GPQPAGPPAAPAGASALVTVPHPQRRETSRYSVTRALTSGMSTTCSTSAADCTAPARSGPQPRHASGSTTRAASGVRENARPPPRCPPCPPRFFPLRLRALGRLVLAPLPLRPAPVRTRTRPVRGRRPGGVLRIPARLRDQIRDQQVKRPDLRVLRHGPLPQRCDHGVLRRLAIPVLPDQRGLTPDPRQQIGDRLPGRRHLPSNGLHDREP